MRRWRSRWHSTVADVVRRFFNHPQESYSRCRSWPHILCFKKTNIQWSFQEPKLEVPYTRPMFQGYGSGEPPPQFLWPKRWYWRTSILGSWSSHWTNLLLQLRQRGHTWSPTSCSRRSHPRTPDSSAKIAETRNSFQFGFFWRYDDMLGGFI